MTTGDNPGNGSWNHNVSIYTPPYLLKGERPAITSVIDTEWTYGDTQRITVDRPIAKAELIRPAAVTHSSDPNQRFVDLPLSVDGNNIDLNVTSNPNLAPPGWYMLFAVDANGVPSVAKWVHLSGPEALKATDASAHVHSFADDLSGKVTGPGKKRTAQKVSPTVSGCDRHLSMCIRDSREGHDQVPLRLAEEERLRPPEAQRQGRPAEAGPEQGRKGLRKGRSQEALDIRELRDQPQRRRGSPRPFAQRSSERSDRARSTMATSCSWCAPFQYARPQSRHCANTSYDLCVPPWS